MADSATVARGCGRSRPLLAGVLLAVMWAQAAPSAAPTTAAPQPAHLLAARPPLLATSPLDAMPLVEMRGGSHYDDAAHLRAARRTKDDPDHASADGGFRCAQTSAPASATPEPLRPRARLPILLRGEVWRFATATRVPTAIPTAVPTATPSPTPAPPNRCAEPLGESYGRLGILGAPSNRPAAEHPDLNLALRGYVRATSPATLVHINGPVDAVTPPQLAGVLGRVPRLTSTHQVIGWLNDRFVGPITFPSVTLLGFETAHGEPIRVPDSGRDIGSGFEVLVLYATEDRLTLKYTREDIVTGGYTIHLENVCADPALLRLYRDLDAAGRRVLPAVEAGKPIGRARSGEILVSIRDGAGSFLDPRSCKDWWQGLCPPLMRRVPGWQDTRRWIPTR